MVGLECKCLLGLSDTILVFMIGNIGAAASDHVDHTKTWKISDVGVRRNSLEISIGLNFYDLSTSYVKYTVDIFRVTKSNEYKVHNSRRHFCVRYFRFCFIF